MKDSLLSADNSVLLVIDMQATLTSVMPEDDAEAMIDNTTRLLEAAKLLNVPVLLTEQYPKGLGRTETRVLDALPKTAQQFAKTHFSCLGDGAENVELALNALQKKQVILVGQETHVCVLQTALELIEKNYQVHLVEDAICSRRGEHKFYALQRLQQQGAIITNYESVLFEWLRDARHPEFKTISQFLK